MRSRLVIAAFAIVIAGCDSPQPAPPPTPDPGPGGPPPGGERITGSERIGWSQQAANGEELSTFRYLIYVDSAAADAQDARCSSTAGPAGFACTARMPSMSAGPHVLSMSSYIDSGGSRLESPRSAAVNVILVAQTTNADSTAGGSFGVASSKTLLDGVRLFSEVVVDGLDDPKDLAFAYDGRILVAERNGRIRVVRGRRLNPAPAISLTDVDASRGGLLSIATDPREEQTRSVFALYTTARGFRLARFRLVADTLGDEAILLDEIPASAEGASGFVRIGPDRRVYVGLDDGGDTRRAGDLGSFNGKILRLNADATTPADQSSGSPVYAADMTAPRGAAWTETGAMWVVDAAALSGYLVQPTAPSGTTAPRYRLPAGSDPSAIAVYQSERPGALRGNVFVAAPGERSILRLVPDAGNATKIASTERLRDETFEGVASIAVARDGAIYVCTAHSLIKVTPRP